MTRTTIMLPPEIKRKAEIEARRLKVSFADFVRQAIKEKLPVGSGSDRLKRRKADPVFRLRERLPTVKDGTPKDVATRHDDYLYGNKSEFGNR